MNYPWLDAYFLSKMGAEKDFKDEWQATRYLIGGKMFGLQGDDNTGKPVITLKLPPAEGEMLRTQYPDIIPGYYMNKLHWNSVYLHGAVPDALLQRMIDTSYNLIFHSLSKTMQRQINSTIV